MGPSDVTPSLSSSILATIGDDDKALSEYFLLQLCVSVPMCAAKKFTQHKRRSRGVSIKVVKLKLNYFVL